MTHLDTVNDFVSEELQAMRMDGELTAYRGFLEDPDGPQERACRILGCYANELVLCSWSAAWAWGCATEPARHFVAFRKQRKHIRDSADFTIQQRNLLPQDLDSHTTTPLRTSLDLLKLREISENIFVAVHHLMSRYDISASAVMRRLDSPKTSPYRTQVSSGLQKLSERYPSETRYTS